jgi:putative DNA methylase
MTQAELLPGMPDGVNDKKDRKANVATGNGNAYAPPNLGKAIRLPVPDFNDPKRPPTCLEVDFPITPINALSNLEGNAGKPIYQMSKWWARRRSSVFRSLLIAAAVKAPDDPAEAAKLVWDHYYANHQKAGTFKKLRVLDPFMGGGTTMVEGVRLGFQMTGIDLNPVAWFVTKNELACSDPALVKAFFDKIEEEVKPLIQPFYTTTCPRGHKGRWIDKETGKPVKTDPLDLPPAERGRYRWEGPEIIYTFWAKHGPCQAEGCRHRTPIFRTPIVAEKNLTTYYIEARCPSCRKQFNIELGETRMAPGVERVVLESEPAFTETTQGFASLLKGYDKGRSEDKTERIGQLLDVVKDEPGLRCPHCGKFAGHEIHAVLERHAVAKRSADIKKKHFEIKRRPIQMYLLLHPDWMKATPGFVGERELGGYAGAPPEDTAEWFKRRLKGLGLIEVRGEGLPAEVTTADGTVIHTEEGTVPEKSEFKCTKCGRQKDILDSVRPTGHTAPVAAYTLQCHCPECDAEGYNYGGRYFKAPDAYDTDRLNRAEREWVARKEKDLAPYWPREQCWDAHMMRANGGVNEGWGYTHWWKMFNPRQMLVHGNLLRAICQALSSKHPLDAREQALGAFQQYLRNHNMFVFWNPQRDTPEPMFSNANFHPKAQVVENCVFATLGRGNWKASSDKIVEGLEWARAPWELVVADAQSDSTKSDKVSPGDPEATSATLLACSSADLTAIGDHPFDLVITDPPFGNNLFYADLADFFYVWMRIPLLGWYEGTPERAYFEPERTPHAAEAIDNPVEHPDDREDWEKELLVEAEHLDRIRELAGDPSIEEHDKNPLYRREPSSEFYCRILTACWAEAARLLKPGGLMAFTFHHSEDAPWVDVLEALFNAGYILVATYPVRSDETKGAGGAFGSRKIEYDIVHVCRKRLDAPQPVAWAKMRRWVKEETDHFRALLEHSHGKELPESDLLVILRGKALEFYSRHYGQVYTGDGQLLSVGEALLGINQLLDDLLAGEGTEAQERPPEEAEPASRLYLRIFQDRRSIPRDDLGKTLRGSGVAPADLEARGWIKTIGTAVHLVPIVERFQYFTAVGRTRKVLKTDLDQAHFLAGAVMGQTGVDVNTELNRGTFTVKRSVDAILRWYAEKDSSKEVRDAAELAGEIVAHWRTRPKAKPTEQMTLFETLEAEGQ